MNRLLLLLFVVAGASQCYAGGHHSCCADCGCNHGLRKVCRWECEEEEVKVPCFDCECEDVVIPGTSPFCIQPICDHCDGCQNGCERCTPHLGGHLHHKKVWGPPGACCVKNIRVLVRKDKTIKKKVWKPVIETVCDRCCAACGSPSGPTDETQSGPTGRPALAKGEQTAAPAPSMPPVVFSDRPSSRRGLTFFSAISPITRER